MLQKFWMLALALTLSRGPSRSTSFGGTASPPFATMSPKRIDTLWRVRRRQALRRRRRAQQALAWKAWVIFSLG